MKLFRNANLDIDAIKPYSPGRPIEDVAKEFGIDPESVIKLASNESAFGVSPKATRAMKEAVELCFRYPDGGAIDLRMKIADTYSVDFDQVLVGNGSNEILELVGHCFMNRNTSTVISRHSFVVYNIVTQLFGARLIDVPMTQGLVHDIDRMVSAIDGDTSVIFICNPNNPTGTNISNADLYRALDTISDDVLIVVDEAYAEVATCVMPETLRYINDRPNILICRTFSKGYGLAGLRLGYGIGPAPLVQLLQKARQPFNVNLMAQIAGTAALDDEEFIAKGKKHYAASKDYFERECQALNLPYIETSTNFMLIDVADGERITQKLQEKGVIVRSMVGYQLPQYLRVTFGTEEQNKRFIDTLKDVL